jgi:hypothetical protein
MFNQEMIVKIFLSENLPACLTCDGVSSDVKINKLRKMRKMTTTSPLASRKIGSLKKMLRR